MQKRVTMKDIALRAGVHPSSVSMALKNHPRIGKDTRQRIQQLAREMGYVPDPALSALSAYRRSQRPVQSMGELAVLSRKNTIGGHQQDSQGYIMQGLVDRAAQTGYSLCNFNVSDENLTPRRINQIIRTRKIQGVILLRLESFPMRFLKEIDWDALSAVRISRRPTWPPITHVEHNQYASMQTCLMHLIRRGYKKIGLIQTWRNLQSIGFFPEAAYLQTLQRSKHAGAAPIYYTDKSADLGMADWIGTHKIEAVISHRSPEDLLPDEKIRQQTFSGVGFICMNLLKPNPKLAGINQNLQKLGTRAVDVVVANIHRGEKGFPAVTSHILIQGTWSEGSSIRRKRRVT
ncbi:LacI family DNA-binding transcriptional regulator [Kiritimatiellaeota bacterium B1221]|nr:LacI family DNA-binding transcriptional regulator [Kiritimatiellaeota bacterium B1221]